MRETVWTISVVLIICGLGLALNATQPQASPWLKPIAVSSLSLGALLAICLALTGRARPISTRESNPPVETTLPDLEQLEHDPRGDL